MAITMAQALNQSLHDAFEKDDRVVLFGEDVGTLGGVFRITDKLQERFGDQRCFDTPLAEAGIAGTAVGMAMYGFRPIIEMQFDGFTYPAFEQIVSHIAKMRNRSRGTVTMPITIRIPFGGGIGAVEHHSESPEAYFAHTAGLKVVTPGTPADAYSLLTESIFSDDPVVFFEPKRRYWMKEDAILPITTEPIGQSVVRRPGTTATLAAYGPMVKTCLETAEAAEAEGWDLEVIDIRSLVPFDHGTIVESVERTGRLVVVHEAQTTAGFGAEVAARVQQHAFYSLEAPVQRVGGFDIPYPAAMLEEFFLPDVDRILDAVATTLEY
ncbi:alpha-ketoacid dehydrogenase subunit beta [Euzebya tangerina]|uniref:alpha-ketoacid dehydrogenase subunit beta n=1 Tax=Euzebya tangerina TaxID=591198 RepID=UPI000E31A9F1|nr:alpha-ketoacid dehydrogenase subunit beta [Euzebya tangerina]